MTAAITVVCNECGRAFETKSRRARFCPDNSRCRKAASRRAKRGVLAIEQPYSLAEALEELAAMLELLPGDIAALESRAEAAGDPVLDELIAGLDANERSLERLQAWLVTFAPADGAA